MTGIVDGSKLYMNGCEVHNNCFTCPFPDCIVAISVSSKPAMFKKAKAFKLAKQGLTPEEIASKLNRTVQCVQEYLAIGSTNA